MKQTKTNNYFPVCVARLLSHPLRCSLGLSFVLYSLLFSAVLLTACSDDVEETRQGVTFEVLAGTTEYTEEVSASRGMSPMSAPFATRADDTDWIPPTYASFETMNGKFAQQVNLVNNSIYAFFSTAENVAPQTGTFFYSKNSVTGVNSWQLRMDELAQGNYYLYGYIPKEDAGSASIESYNGTAPNGNNSYSTGAVLTLTDLNTVSPSDVCVIVGAKDGDAINELKTAGEYMNTGDFKIHAYAATKDNVSPGTPNFLFLLFDHLYTALRFNFTIDATYDALRTIKLRKLEMRAWASETEYVTEKCNATIKLLANNSNLSPIESVVFDISNAAYDSNHPDKGFKDIYTYNSSLANEVVLTTTKPESFMGCLVPGSSYNIELRSTYDVYDKNVTPAHPEGNLIRRGCQAVNKLNLLTIFGEYTQLQRGQCYSLTMKVQPTYLYMLSEPDLDNPTIRVEN